MAEELKWIRVRLSGVARLTERGWQWRTVTRGGRVRLALESPRGVWWEFKLVGGAWLRRFEP